ncbi:MAG: 3,4-dihydroxy-2-butanone-4-phosphate synthase [Alteromonadaceae bacterium]|nr:MAG: 3,4-dihydroxy-2-butanone-4-phosphate synthase [Alteromonadaceae bacterium]
MQLNTIDEILDDIRLGKMVILMDDEDRENEGDLIMAAEQVRPEDINFMATYARGLICLTLTEEKCRQLELPLMVRDNGTEFATNFTVSIEAAVGVTTGISATDRAKTVRAAVNPSAVARDLVQPGHIFPVMAQRGGVLTRAGHTEAGCDLARFAGFSPSALIVEIMNEDGSMARRPELELFAQKHDLKIGTISDLIQYRAVNEKTVTCVNERKVNTQYGEFVLKTFHNDAHNELHFALVRGEISPDKPTLVRVHVGNTAKDVLCIQSPGQQSLTWGFQSALKRIADEGEGVLVLICHNETTREIDESIDWILSGKQVRPKHDMVYKQVGAGAQILKDLGVKKMRLMSAALKFRAISGFDLEVSEYVDP